MKIYLDTTIPSYAASYKTTPEIAITKNLVKRIKKGEFEPFASFLTIQELEATPSAAKREKLLTIFTSMKLVIIEPDEKMAELAEEYTKANIIPKEFEADAIHVACAVISNIPVIVTWNLKHMANIFIKQRINALNLKTGYPQIDIVTPLEI